MFGAFALTPSSAQIDNALSSEPTDPSANEITDFTSEPAQFAYDAGNFKDALVLAKNAAAQGDQDAQFLAGHILMRGDSGVVDTVKAAEYLRQAVDSGHTDAMMALGELSLRAEAGLTASDALHWFSKAAQKNRPDAMRAIGEMYMKGQGLAPDADKGMQWLRKAVDFGDGIACRLIADSFFETDAPEALRWYEKAADRGDYEAAYVAAIMYEENFDIRPNVDKMAALLEQAANGGYPPAQADFGLLVYQGRGVEPSSEKAAEWFETAAKNGDTEGQFLYAFTLAKGDGVAQSFEDAYYWLLKSGESGIGAYDKDREILRERLEKNVDPALLAKARARFEGKTSAAE